MSDAQINASLIEVAITAGAGGSETGPYNERCRPETEGEAAPRYALYPTMRVLSDSKMQPTHHSNKSGMYKRAVMVKTNPRGEYNAMEK